VIAQWSIGTHAAITKPTKKLTPRIKDTNIMQIALIPAALSAMLIAWVPGEISAVSATLTEAACALSIAQNTATLDAAESAPGAACAR
jgi:hypothetical protein